MDRLLVLLAVVAVTGLLAVWWRRRDGRVTTAPTAIGLARGHDAADIAAAVKPATPLVLVEFTAPGCVSCGSAKVVLEDVAAGRDDLSVVAVDVGDALDLARAHRIMRAPTTLLISADGHLLGRVGGIPRRPELVALLDAHGQASAA